MPEEGLQTPPRHIAIIMDGNGRWAAVRHLPRKAGHHQGLRAAYRSALNAKALGVRYLTLFSFSSENWLRPPDEVRDLMGLFRLFFRAYLKELIAHEIRLRVIGSREGLAPDICDLIAEGEEHTRHLSGLDLVIAFNYGARSEILNAARALARDVAAGRINPEDIQEPDFAAQLTTRDIPDPDLLIRTSGEQRISNFLLWQCAYTEFVFQDVLWPDYDRAHMEAGIAIFWQRERRFGGRESAGARELTRSREAAGTR